MISRYPYRAILKDLKQKMVFIGGPRQCGKTTLAEQILKGFPYRQSYKGIYFNWDDDDDRRDILKKHWGDDHQLVVFDEIHKYKRWKSWIKGVFDKQKTNKSFLVTGSARLDTYRRGGDSLMGRYHYWRLHPLTLEEIPKKIKPRLAIDRLMRVGGFPEPFLDGSERFARRWRKERFDRILRDDIRDLESIRDISTLSLFVDALRERVGGLVVLGNIAQDLQVSPKTLKNWLTLLEKMYVVFVVWPYTKKLPRAIQKPPKVYFFDNADVRGDEGACFENMVATHLLKHIHYQEDYHGYRYELRYVRDKEGREVDFVVLKEGKVDALYEAKYAQQSIDRSLAYYAERLKPKQAKQIVYNLKRPISKDKLSVVSFLDEFSDTLISP